MSDAPRMGPVALCTIVARDGAAVAAGYTRWLHQRVVFEGALDHDTASSLGFPELEGHQHWLLANERGRQWLQIVEAPQAADRDSLLTLGWLAMEVLVQDVDALAESLAGSNFELLRPPANLDVSDKIRACQVRGPAGEVLYLTQISGEVPPFELPRCEAIVDHLFIPVLSTPSRDDSLDEYSQVSGNSGMSFDTKITVVNQARCFELDRRHPVATLQLAGNAMLEIDQIDQSQPGDGALSCGMACVTFYCKDTAPKGLKPCLEGPFAGQLTDARIGCADEHYTLVYC